jgi:hypothetical protein
MTLLMMFINVLIIILVLLIIRPVQGQMQQGGSLNAPFSLLTSKEMDGIPSLAGKVNPKNESRPVIGKDQSKGPAMTYYGHGMSLRPVEPGPLLDPLKIVHNAGIAVKPECCPSPYSYDNGCLCGALEDITMSLTGRRNRNVYDEHY